MIKGIKKSAPFKQTPVRPKALPPEYNNWYWHPNRGSVRTAPDWFMAKLKDVDPDGLVRITWNPIRERWQVFARDYKVQHPICWGWKLLFVVEQDGEYVPLDERTLAKIYERSGRKWGNLYEYWLKVEQVIERETARAEKNRHDAVGDTSGDYYDYMQIKNIGKGSKFTQFHAGE